MGGSAALALVVALAGEVRAASYAYATQNVNTFAFSSTPAGATIGTLTTQATSGALNTQGATPSGIAGDTAQFDPAAAFVGPGPGPGQNVFAAVGPSNPDYSRGDAQITQPGFAISTVGEGFLTPPGRETGSGSFIVSAPITLTTASTVTLTFNYTNDLNVFLTEGPGLASASNNFTFTITTLGGTTILFTSSPSAVNNSVSLAAVGANDIAPGAGSISITSGQLAAGTYTASISGGSRVELNQFVIPEPSSVLLLGTGLTIRLGSVVRRGRKTRSAS